MKRQANSWEQVLHLRPPHVPIAGKKQRESVLCRGSKRLSGHVLQQLSKSDEERDPERFAFIVIITLFNRNLPALTG